MTKDGKDKHPSTWDDGQVALGGHLYQSATWAGFQEQLGRSVHMATGSDWSWMASKRRARGGFRYLYAAYGPSVLSAVALREALGSMVVEAQRQAVDFIRMEPMGASTSEQLRALGARRVADMQPSHRLLLDLTPDVSELRRSISASNRNLINGAEARGLSFRTSDDPADMEAFLALQRLTFQHNGIVAHPDSYYTALARHLLPRGEARLYFASHGGVPIATAICMDYARTRYYVYAATDPVANRQHKAAVALLWWLITDAKDAGLGSFDCGGVSPEDQPDHAWAGHSKFKRSLGGVTVTSMGTWELPIRPVRYRLMQLAKRVVGS
jgi:Acetyltransferase (GNAT) domain